MVCVWVALSLAAGAHHSFAVFFDQEKTVRITGKVTDFKFANPHGVITLEVTGDGSKPETWKAETNAVTLLRRRGWTKSSLSIGETITVEGWPARDGSRYLRMRKVTRADGSLVGEPIGVHEATEQK